MTEKRFTIKHYEDSDWIYDNDKVIHASKVVNLLNTLYEENTEYKQELDNIYLLIGRGDWSGLVDLLICDEKSKTE